MSNFLLLDSGTIVNVENISHIYFAKRGKPYESSYCISLIKNGKYTTEFDITENDYRMFVNKLIMNNNNE